MTNLGMCTRAFRRFLGAGEAETVELTTFDAYEKVSVAYARTVADHVRLLEQGQKRPDFTGAYTVFNEVHEGLHARFGSGKWHPGKARASDNDVTTIRSVYIDFDARRPKGISATDAEKSAACEVCAACEAYLAQAVGDPSCIARGDSGNGAALFIAIEPIRLVKLPLRESIALRNATKTKVQRFLQAIAQKFETPRVTIDTSVCNAARLCPAFGTRKAKGIDCPERPHRLTEFHCADIASRIPIEALS